MKKNKLIFILILFLTVASNLFFSENINFFVKTLFSNSQFWESQLNDSNPQNPNDIRNVFTNFFSGGIGFGMEFIIWDMTKARGSRLFFKTSADFIFSGITYAGYYDNSGTYITPDTFVSTASDHSMHQLNINDGLFLTGLDLDLFFGGSFPRTDLIWGFGCIFDFLFPTYSPKYDIPTYFLERSFFYAVPAVLLGYDINIPNTKFKITPQIRVGFTCNPVIPGDLLKENNPNNDMSIDYMDANGNMLKRYGTYEKFISLSGPYIDFSIAFTFGSIQWKK